MTESPHGHDPRRGIPAPHPVYVSASPPTSGMAVAALVLGIVGAVGGWCTFAVPCVLAVIFGYVGLGRTRGGARGGRGMAVAGLVLGLVPLGIIVVLLLVGGIGFLLAPVASVSSSLAGKTPAPVAAPQGKGPVVKLDRSLTIALADGHHLKFGMALQLAAGQSDQLDTSAAVNLAIDNYTGREIGDLATQRGRDEAKRDLVVMIKSAYSEAVIDVYVTQFVTQ